MDIVGPLPPSKGYSYLLTCVDRYTRWLEAIPISSITAEDAAHALLQGWISRFGLPSIIVTDSSRQFESALWCHLMNLLGTRRARTNSYHPQSNGMVERFHRQLKVALKAQPNTTLWMDALPLIMLGIRTDLKEDLSATIAEMVYGMTLRLPREFFTSSNSQRTSNPINYVSRLKAHMHKIQPTPPRLIPPSQASSHVSEALATATHVFVQHDTVRKPLQAPYNGPYRILKRNEKIFTLDINGCKDTVSVDRLKPAHLDLPIAPTQTQSKRIT